MTRPNLTTVAKQYPRELTLAGALLALLLLLAIAAPGFYQLQPLRSLLTREAPALLVTCGMAFVILCRQIDISVGSQFAVCSVVAGHSAAAGHPAPVILLIALATGAALGTLNGSLVAGLGLPSIVVTLATMVALREGLRWLQQGAFVNLPDGVQWLGIDQATAQTLLLSLTALITLSLVLASEYLAAGRFVRAVGSDAETARLTGLKPRTITFTTLVLLGTLAGLAAYLNLLQSPQVDPKTGSGLEMKAIAAVVIGGVAISGGYGRLSGVVLGFLLLVSLSPALTHLRIHAYWEKALQGAVILIAVIADALKSRKANPHP